VAILAGTFLKRVPENQELAEKAVMEQTVGAMQSALTMRVGSMMVHGAATEKGLKALASENPINLLQEKPKSYAGEFFDPKPNTVAPGHWMFDLKTHDLIYVPDRSDFFKPGKDGQKWVRFHVTLVYDTGAGGNNKELAATLFEPVEPYRWFN
jgi:general secretion pathway protein G